MEMDDARRCFETALAAAEVHGALRIAAECHAGLGELLGALGCDEIAFQHLYKALELAKQAETLRAEVDTFIRKVRAA